MKRFKTYLLIVLIITGMMAVSCGGHSSGEVKNVSADTTGTSVISFQEREHDFGKVKEGEKLSYIFTYKNTGRADLVVTAASASCGCTVPKFDKKPVHPGDSGTLEVIFDTSGKEGLQTKTIVVQSNAKDNLVILRIIANVI